MTKLSHFFVAALLFSLIAVSFQSCLEDECSATRRYQQYVPVYKNVDAIRQEVKAEAPQELKSPGIIYVYGHYLLINERREGIHVLDNSNPENPVGLAFIPIPGNGDMAVRDGILYADNYIDLLSIDISDPLAPRLLKRSENVFENYDLHEDFGYLVEWKPEEVFVDLPCSETNFRNPFFWDNNLMFVGTADQSSFEAAKAEVGGNIAAPSGTGVGGSMARFTISQKHLYTLGSWNLRVFSLDADGCPEISSKIPVDWANMETIFPYQEYLFVGADNGMYIFDNTDPREPVYLSDFRHVRTCDPVYVADDIAYVTLNGNGPCGGFSNQLDVLDVSNITNPRLIKTYPMSDPHGLAVTEETLYLCDGNAGLKVYETDDLNAIDKHQIDHFTGFETFDVIPLPDRDLLIVIGPDGLHQFSTADKSNIKELSMIAVNP